jgi:hypothetical protein
MKVWLWDCGPEEPILPEPPTPPEGKPGEPKFDLAAIKFKRAVAAYETALLEYEARDKEFSDWRRDKGGPTELLQWSCDARDSFVHDARAVREKRQKNLRYFLSHRTRGYENRASGPIALFGSIPCYLGLPEGVQPGHGHELNLRRQAEQDADFVRAMKRDPIFGEAK